MWELGSYSKIKTLLNVLQVEKKQELYLKKAHSKLKVAKYILQFRFACFNKLVQIRTNNVKENSMKIYIRFGLMAFWVLALNSLNLLFAQERIPFTNYEGVELEARIDEITGTATQIYGIRESVELYSLSRAQLDSSSIVQLGADMIRSYSEQLGISSRDMQVRNISTDGSWWFAEYKQQVRGIPVKYSEIGFTIDPEGYIVTLGA